MPLENRDVLVQLAPAPHVAVALNGTLTFECTVNNTDYHIHWSISYYTSDQNGFDFEVTFHNDTSSTLSFTATREMNNTIVTCSVQDGPNEPLIDSISATVWIQGILNLNE